LETAICESQPFRVRHSAENEAESGSFEERPSLNPVIALGESAQKFNNGWPVVDRRQDASLGLNLEMGLVGLARLSTRFLLSSQKKSGKEKAAPLPLESFASAPHLGRLAQLSLVASKQRWLLRTSNSARRLTQLTLDAKARQRGRVTT
jgi:hypothetical protein